MLVFLILMGRRPLNNASSLLFKSTDVAPGIGILMLLRERDQSWALESDGAFRWDGIVVYCVDYTACYLRYLDFVSSFLSSTYFLKICLIAQLPLKSLSDMVLYLR